MSEERLQKLLARAGVASRRHVEELIRDGRVTVNGAPAGLGDKADPERDAVKVDGKRIDLRDRPEVYLVLNKPKAVMSTVSDPQGRRTVMELVPPGLRKGLVPVGRLDFMTEGLLLMTTDGDFAQKISHPRHGCAKVYEVRVSGRPEESQLDRLRGGIVLEGKRTAPCRIDEHRPSGPRTAEQSSWWRVELQQGRTRQIREMFSRIGHSVIRLRRVGIGSLLDPGLPLGTVRELTPEEVERLRTDPTPPRPKRKPRTERTRRAGSEKAESPRPAAGKPQAGTSKLPLSRAKAQGSTAKPRTGTARPQPAKAKPPSGSAKPRTGTARPQSAKAKPPSGSAKPRTSSARPQSGRAKAQTSTSRPRPPRSAGPAGSSRTGTTRPGGRRRS